MPLLNLYFKRIYYFEKKSYVHFVDTIKPVFNDHPWDPKIVAVVDSWSLFRGHLCNKTFR